jgi:hypothetical protein
MAVNMHADSSIRSGPVGFGISMEWLLFHLISAWGISFEFPDDRISGKISRQMNEDPCSKLQGSSTVRNAVIFMIRSLSRFNTNYRKRIQWCQDSCALSIRSGEWPCEQVNYAILS